MTLEQLLAKFEGVLLSAPMLRAEILDMVQDERADERNECMDTISLELVQRGEMWLNEVLLAAIRNRNEKEVG